MFEDTLLSALSASESMKESKTMPDPTKRNKTIRKKRDEWLQNGYKIKNKKINRRNNYDKCFQYALTVTLIYRNIKKKSRKTNKN